MCAHTHREREKPVHTERHKQRQTCRLIQLRVSSIIQHSAHRHRLKQGIKHARGPHLEIMRTLPVFKMQCWEVKIDLGWFSLPSFSKYTNKNHQPFTFSTPQIMGPFIDALDIRCWKRGVEMKQNWQDFSRIIFNFVYNEMNGNYYIFLVQWTTAICFV